MKLHGRQVTIGFILICFAILTLIATPAAADPESGSRRVFPRNVLDVGAQFISPGGGLSGRYWFENGFGLEGNGLFWSAWSQEYSRIEGTGSVRVLYRLTAQEAVNFYLAGGGVYRTIYSSREERYRHHTSLVGTGGIEFSPLSPRFLLNFEFGMHVSNAPDGFQGSNRLTFGPTFGAGIHYRFGELG
ncbi:MAG: hypothetical protein ACOCZX_00010 [Candidatus Bipolaricaulota bacterium]